jgi:dextranase
MAHKHILFSLIATCGLLLVTSAAQATSLDWAGDAKNNAENGFLAPSQDLMIVVDSSPLKGATGARVQFTTNTGKTRETRAMTHHGTSHWDQHDQWKLSLGHFPEGTAIEYAIKVIGTNQTLRIDDNGRPFRVTVDNERAAIRWIGNMRTQPEAGELDSGEELSLRCEMKPIGVAISAEVGVSIDNGASWTNVPMVKGRTVDKEEAWFSELGTYPEGTAIRYYIRGQNANGDSTWDSNTGSDYRIRVQSPIRDITMDKARYNPGETAHIAIDLQPASSETNGELTIQIRRLGQVLSQMKQTISFPSNGIRTVTIPWTTPPEDFQGYGIDVDWMVDGEIRDSRSSAIDVSSDWTRFPRFGFFSEYPDGDDAEGQSSELATFHLNAIQFYDWKWTHDRLVPYAEDGTPADVFTQVGGRVQSFQTVKDKIDALHDRNIAAMSYTLMYGDSGNSEPEHIEWAAFKVPNSTNRTDIRKHDAGSYKIWVMDVSNPGWKTHLFSEFIDAIDKAGFDGIHLDNLGAAQNYRYNSDDLIPEREAFPQFISEAREHIRKTTPDARLTHNDVMGNYLNEIAASDSDIYYSEVWSRHSYQDIRDNIREAQIAGNGKPVVLAAYINRKPWDEMGNPSQPPLPTFINDASAKLMAATVFANGGFRIELGNDGDMLVNEYFPLKKPRMHEGLRRSMRDIYDFVVRYENWLAYDPLHPLRDTTDSLSISSDTHKLSKRGDSGVIWTLAKTRNDGALALNLINLYGVDDQWRNVSANPKSQTNITLKVKVDTPVQQVLLATPDDGLGRAVEVPFKQRQTDGDIFITITVPSLNFWDLILLIPTEKN